MGIANDIRPRKKHRPEPEDKDSAKQKIENFEAAPVDDKTAGPAKIEPAQKDLDKLEDQFFSDLSDHKKPEKTEEIATEKPRRTGYIILFWVLVFIGFIAYAVYQNYSDNSDQNKGSSKINQSEDRVYSGEAVTQDQVTAETPTTTTPTTTAPASTSPAQTTSTPTLDKSLISVKVLNGNGITGSAQKIRSQLLAAGFKVGAATNAKNFSYPDTLIYYKSGKSQEAQLVKETLGKGAVQATPNDDIVTATDVVVVVGKN